MATSIMHSTPLPQLRAMGSSLSALHRASADRLSTPPLPAERRLALRHLAVATAVALVCVALVAAWTGRTIAQQVEVHDELLSTLAPQPLDLVVETAPIQLGYDPHAPAVAAP